MTILVTGGTGLIGSHLDEQLVAEGHRERVLVRPASQRGELVDLPVEWVNGDLLDAGSLQTAMHGVKQVYHLAATMDDWGPWELFYEANVTGTENVCAAALAAGVERLIFTSSIAATGLEDYSGLKDESFPYVDSQRQGQRGIRHAPLALIPVSTVWHGTDRGRTASCGGCHLAPICHWQTRQPASGGLHEDRIYRRR